MAQKPTIDPMLLRKMMRDVEVQKKKRRHVVTNPGIQVGRGRIRQVIPKMQMSPFMRSYISRRARPI